MQFSEAANSSTNPHLVYQVLAMPSWETEL